jgi:hypothetical protein
LTERDRPTCGDRSLDFAELRRRGGIARDNEKIDALFAERLDHRVGPDDELTGATRARQKALDPTICGEHDFFTDLLRVGDDGRLEHAGKAAFDRFRDTIRRRVDVTAATEARRGEIDGDLAGARVVDDADELLRVGVLSAARASALGPLGSGRCACVVVGRHGVHALLVGMRVLFPQAFASSVF